jgi:2-polyprenyl-3-methyl-5-hydroxy-6-metoxy-1,4-benzoquinol methylase
MDSPDAFWQSLASTSAAVRSLYLAGLGAELDYWNVLCDDTAVPISSSKLAKLTDCAKLATQIWCEAMAAAGVLECEGINGMSRYVAPKLARTALMKTETLIASCDLSHLEHRSKLMEIFHHGGGMSWAEFHPRVAECTCCSMSGTYQTALIPSLPDAIVQKLKVGGAIADVGCGHGAAACMFAAAFPSAHVYGFDYHAPSIEAANDAAARKGLRNVRFGVNSSTDFAAEMPLDIICFLDCFHDMATATSAAKYAFAALKPDGMLFLVEPMGAAHDSIAEQLAIPMAQNLSAMSCHICLPCASTDEGAQA